MPGLLPMPGLLANTQPFEPGWQPGVEYLRWPDATATVIGELMVPELLVTCMEVGYVNQGHHAKYHPF